MASNKPHEETEAIDYFSSDHPLRGVTTGIAHRARKKMYQFLQSTVALQPQMRILDIGVTPDRKLADSNFFEQLYPYKDKITATSIEDAAFLEDLYPGLRFIQTDGRTLPFEDGEFDLAVSFAVLEHVGNRESQQQFIQEMLRVSKRFFLTTPNRQFPVELHTFLPFIHWLPQAKHQAILRKLGLGFWAETANLNLLEPRSLLELFRVEPAPVVNLKMHRLLGLPSNLIVYGTSRPQDK